jgi:hypothetical protein
MNWFDRLYALANEIDANTRRLNQAEAQARRQVVHREIPDRLGRVTVSASGPVAIDLDARELRYTNGAAVGAAVLRAIRAAETELCDRYTHTMADARRDVAL